MIYEIADRCTKEVEKISEEWEIYIANVEAIEIESQKDVLNFAKKEIDKVIGIRIIKDNRMGFAYTSDLDKIPETAKKAVENSKLNKIDENWEFSKEEKITEIKGNFDTNYDNLSVEDYCEFLENIIERTKENRCEITTCGLSASKGEELILNSNGVSIYDKSTGYSGGLSVNLEKNGEYSTAYDYESSKHFDIEYEKLTDDVCKLAHDSLNPKSIETRDCNLVLDYYAASGLLSTFINSFSAENTLRKRSVLHDKIGEEITDSGLTITDNPLIENGMMSSKADGEGSPSRETVLVEKGVLKSFLYNIYTANKADCETTSNGYRLSYLTTPNVSPSNVVLDFENEISIDEIDTGVLTTGVLGAHTANPISGDFSVELTNAFTIENGEVKDSIKKAMISGNVFDMMKNCCALKSDIKQKGSFIIPKILADEVKVIGL